MPNIIEKNPQKMRIQSADESPAPMKDQSTLLWNVKSVRIANTESVSTSASTTRMPWPAAV